MAVVDALEQIDALDDAVDLLRRLSVVVIVMYLVYSLVRSFFTLPF